MLTPYRRVLSLPGAAAFSGAAFVTRIPMAMNGLGIVLLISTVTGSYGLAGAVAGVSALAGAVGGLLLARLVDRHGQARVLRPGLLVHAAGMAALILTVRAGAPGWVYFVAAIVAGAGLPALGPLVRARWSALLRGDPRLQTAFALESVLDEVIFVGGPVLVTWLDTSFGAGSGLGTAVALTVLGGYALAALRSTEPAPAAARPVGVRRVRWPAGVWLITTVNLALGTVFAALEVTVVAFADERGARSAAGYFLAALAAGSLLAGLAYGARTWRSGPATRLVIVLAGLALVLVPPVFAESFATLAVTLFLAGLGIAPSLIIGASLAEQMAPEGSLTAVLTITVSGLAIGLTVGSSVAGALIDVAGARSGFVVAAVAAAVAALTALAGARRLAAAARPGRPDLRIPSLPAPR